MTLEQYIEQYKTAIEARNFHYQNFSTWTAYFSVIVGALFVAFYSVKDSGSFSVLVALIGFVVSLCWHWSNKGYTYWWHHWSLLLDDMEEKISSAYNDKKRLKNDEIKAEKYKESYGRVYGVFYGVKGNFLCPTKPANISTSKVALLISFIIAVAWCYLIIAESGFLCDDGCSCWLSMIKFLISVLLTWIIVAFGGMFFQSNLNNHLIVEKDGIVKYTDNNTDDRFKEQEEKKCGFVSGKCVYKCKYNCKRYKLTEEEQSGSKVKTVRNNKVY